jgi:hypothetical protein
LDILFEPTITIKHASYMVNIHNLLEEIKINIQKQLSEDVDVSMGIATGECDSIWIRVTITDYSICFTHWFTTIELKSLYRTSVPFDIFCENAIKSLKDEIEVIKFKKRNQ